MNEYKKRLAQQGNQQNNESVSAPQGINGIPNSVLNDVFAGKRRATNEMMGHRVDPAPSVLARMSQAFGMDFSGVQVYRSDAMNGTGMQGMAQGNKVVLGSDVDLNTQAGQAILGHEFSHIRAQSMGIGGGSGLLQDAGLEHQADNEGLLAARGMSISGESMGMSAGLGMAGFEGLTPLGGGMSATAAAPMQAFVNPLGLLSKDLDEYARMNRKIESGGVKSLSEKEKNRYTRLDGKVSSLIAEHNDLVEKHNRSQEGSGIRHDDNGIQRGVTLRRNEEQRRVQRNAENADLTKAEFSRLAYLQPLLKKMVRESSNPISGSKFSQDEIDKNGRELRKKKDTDSGN